MDTSWSNTLLVRETGRVLFVGSTLLSSWETCVTRVRKNARAHVLLRCFTTSPAEERERERERGEGGGSFDSEFFFMRLVMIRRQWNRPILLRSHYDCTWTLLKIRPGCPARFDAP